MTRKSLQHKHRSENGSAGKPPPSSPLSPPGGEGIASSNALEDAFTSFPDAIILCDRRERILRMNPAALTLFGVASERMCLGVPYQQFLQPYQIRDARERQGPPEAWLPGLLLNEEMHPRVQERLLLFRTPSGQNIYLNLCSAPLRNARHHIVGMILVFHEVTPQYQEAVHLQQVQQAVAGLTEAIAQIPAQGNFSVPEATFLLSPPIAFIAQQVVEVIARVLECYQLILVAFEPPAGHLYYVAGSGFTAEQEQQFQANRGRFLLSDMVDETVIARLKAGQEVMVPARSLSLPSWYPPSFERENDLLVPLFLEQQWVGLLGIAKDGSAHEYTREERALVQAAVTYAALIMECFQGVCACAEANCREQMLDEVQRLSNDFLTLAAHELRTPLTWVKGNLQLAQRRVQALKRQLTEESEPLAQVQRSLAVATQGTQLQERMIQDLLDDACIQADHLELSLKPCDLLSLVEAAVVAWRQSMPERAMLLETPRAKQGLPILADADRLTRVLNRYFENALSASPAHRPVTVRVEVKGDIARVSVHHEGVGIPVEEQGCMWERSIRAQGSAVQQSFDLSLGFGLYLCRVFIERHHGCVGVQSAPGQGATFWFSLPLVPSPAQ